MNQTLLKRFFVIITAILLFLSFCLFINFIDNNVEHFLDSDKSSELVYARLLAKENKLISKNWFFPTEIRLLSNPLIYSLIFRFTSNWHEVRLYSYIIIFCCLLLSYFLLCYVLKCVTFFFITGLLLVIPFSVTYFRFMIVAPDYSPFLFISFLALFLCEEYMLCYSKYKSISKIVLIFSLLLSVLAGMNGPRQILNYYLPAFVSSAIILVLETNIKSGSPVFLSSLKTIYGYPSYYFFKFNIITFGGSCLGYLINIKILSKQFSFYSFDSFYFSKFNVDRLSDIISNLLICLGFVEEKSVFSSVLLYNLFCFVWLSIFIYAISYALKNKSSVSPSYYRTSLITLFAFILNILCLLFTNIINEERYHIPLIIFSLPIIAQFFSQYKWNLIPHKLAVFLLALLTSINVFRYRSLKDADETAELRNISSTLTDMGYINGYATFWNANITTELSNGIIDVWCFGNDKLESFQWLQLTSHVSTFPKGKTFIIITPSELQQYNFENKLPDDKLIYKSDDYLVYGYDNYHSLFNDLKISH